MKLARLRTGTAIVIATALWAGLDALVHVRADEVEPLRIAGNIAVFFGLAVVLLLLAASRFLGSAREIGRPRCHSTVA